MSLVLASQNFKGYMSDIARDQLPPNVAYRMKDWIPEFGTRMRKRGGWTYSSPDVTVIDAAAGGIQALAWAPFRGDEHLLMVTANGKVFYDRTFSGAAATEAATALTSGSPPTRNPFWHGDLNGMVITCKNPGLGVVEKYTLVTPPSAYDVALLGGTPPSAVAGASWGDYLLLANGQVAGTNYYNRIWVSGVGAPESWTPGTNFWDSVIPEIVQVVTARSGILVFGYANISIISGDTPPAGGNWSEDIAFHGVGCMDARTIAKYGDTIIFADVTGVYATDGVTLKDLTAAAGVKQNWQSLVSGFGTNIGVSNWKAAGGILRDKYIISVLTNTNAIVTTHVFDLKQPSVYEFTNLAAITFGHRSLGKPSGNVPGEEFLFAADGGGRAKALHPMFLSPDTTADGDGTSVLPQIETPFYKAGGSGKKIFRSMRATYDVRAGTSPTLSVDYCTTPGGAYSNAGSLPTTTDEDRQRVDIRQRATGIGLRLTQVGQSTRTSLGDIELDVNQLEGMR